MKMQDPNRIVLGEKKKKNKLRILLDLDGICAYWEKSAAHTCGLDYEDKEIRDALKNGKRLEKFVGGDSKMWPMIDKEGEDWWTNLEKLPWTDKLIDLLKQESDDFCILTSPNRNPICASGKIKWMQQYFGETFKDFLIGANKHLCATPDSLLIDDTEKKVNKFREYGGHAFLWPHPLKIIDGDIKIEDVIQDLKDYIKEIR